MTGEMQTLGHVHSSSFRSLCSLHSGSLHITSLFFAVDWADDDAPLRSRVRCGLAVPARSSHHAAHRVRRC